jgi:hypothetical protein
MTGHDSLQTNQLIAAFGALAFLATAALLVASAAALMGALALGEERVKQWTRGIFDWVFGGRGLRGKIVAAAVILVAGYGTTLAAFSISSREYTLNPGQEKYFCEIDCHLAYSVPAVEVAAQINDVRARGTFYIVTLKTRFDETTISPRRGDGPLQPSPRQIALLDDAGRAIPISPEAEQALRNTSSAGAPLDTPLRPGESCTTRIAFDVPPTTQRPRLLVASPSSPSWLGSLIIGEEDSFLHKKTLLALPNPTVHIQ